MAQLNVAGVGIDGVGIREIRINYDTFGRRSGRPLLLVMGLGAQMIHWRDEFCELLAGRDHHVIRFDNRDAGLSEKFGHLGVPDMGELATKLMAGEPAQVAPHGRPHRHPTADFGNNAVHAAGAGVPRRRSDNRTASFWERRWAIRLRRSGCSLTLGILLVDAGSEPRVSTRG